MIPPSNRKAQTAAAPHRPEKQQSCRRPAVNSFACHLLITVHYSLTTGAEDFTVTQYGAISS